MSSVAGPSWWPGPNPNTAAQGPGGGCGQGERGRWGRCCRNYTVRCLGPCPAPGRLLSLQGGRGEHAGEGAQDMGELPARPLSRLRVGLGPASLATQRPLGGPPVSLPLSLLWGRSPPPPGLTLSWGRGRHRELTPAALLAVVPAPPVLAMRLGPVSRPPGPRPPLWNGDPVRPRWPSEVEEARPRGAFRPASAAVVAILRSQLAGCPDQRSPCRAPEEPGTSVSLSRDSGRGSASTLCPAGQCEPLGASPSPVSRLWPHRVGERPMHGGDSVHAGEQMRE